MGVSWLPIRGGSSSGRTWRSITLTPIPTVNRPAVLRILRLFGVGGATTSVLPQPHRMSPSESDDVDPMQFSTIGKSDEVDPMQIWQNIDKALSFNMISPMFYNDWNMSSNQLG